MHHSPVSVTNVPSGSIDRCDHSRQSGPERETVWKMNPRVQPATTQALARRWDRTQTGVQDEARAPCPLRPRSMDFRHLSFMSVKKHEKALPPIASFFTISAWSSNR